MTLMELFQSDAAWRERLTKIMTERCRMRYKRDTLRATIHASTSAVDKITMSEVYELHWFLHPNDPRRVPKQNMTRPRKQRPKKDRVSK